QRDVTGSDRNLLDALCAWLAIPSVSSGDGDPHDLRHAATWLRDLMRAAGGSAELVETPRNPLVVGELRSSRADAPTVLVYGHYDVQSAEPLDAWSSPPFVPQLLDG